MQSSEPSSLEPREPNRPLLLSTGELEASSIVANCRMNRERGLQGSNGYAKELGFEPLELLRDTVARNGSARWLDLCCGSGKALIEAAQQISNWEDNCCIEIIGVDLVDMFARRTGSLPNLRLIPASLATWQLDKRFDLITCVHGLHYIGDKLGLLTRAIAWLTDEGRFTASLSLENIHSEETRQDVAKWLRQSGIHYNGRSKRIRRDGHRALTQPFQYIGADDQAGPNYSGQPAINSHYTRPLHKT